MKTRSFLAMAALAVAGAAQAQSNISSTQEEYQIYRWATSAPKRAIIAAATQSLTQYASGWQTVTPIVMDAPPSQAARFKLTDPLANSPFRGMMALSGAGSALRFRVATCDGAVWISNIQRDISGAQHLKITACLFPSTTGYDLDLYMTDFHDNGGHITQMIGRAIAERMVGSPEAWKNRMEAAIVADISQAAGSAALYVEGQPDKADAAAPTPLKAK